MAIAQILQVTLGQLHAMGVVPEQVTFDQHAAHYAGHVGADLSVEEQLLDEAFELLWGDTAHSMASLVGGRAAG
ncbi:hypothetical protein D9M68_804380 [compost metagenome]